MNCNDIKDKLDLYILDEVPNEEKIAIDKHLSACESCKNTFKQQSQITSAVATHYKQFKRELPKAFHESVVKSVENERPVKNPTTIRVAFSAAAILILSLVVYLALPKDEPIGHMNGRTIAKGETVSTEKEEIKLKMDGKDLVLKEQSKLKVIDKEIIELKTGTVNVDIFKKSNFEVRTNMGTAKAQGTKFQVILSAVMTVTVFSGTVQVANDRGKEIASENETIVITPNSPPKIVSSRDDEKAKKMIEFALDWFARHQNEDGSWSLGYTKHCKRSKCIDDSIGDKEYNVGATGLVLCAFLGASITPNSKDEHSKVVKKAIEFLREQQEKNGQIGKDSDNMMYNHVIAALALSEAFYLTKDKELKKPVELALKFILDAQNDGMGWRYKPKYGNSDSSVTGWVVLFLNSAKHLKLDVPDKAFQGAENWFKSVTDKDTGIVGYDRKWEKGYPMGSSIRAVNDKHIFKIYPSVTGMGIVSRILCDKSSKDDKEIKNGIKTILDYKPSWGGDHGTVDFYYWLHATLAIYLACDPKSEDVKKWDKALYKALVESDRQHAQDCSKGSWDPGDRWSCKGGKVVMTATGALILEIYTGSSRVLGIEPKH